MTRINRDARDVTRLFEDLGSPRTTKRGRSPTATIPDRTMATRRPGVARQRDARRAWRLAGSAIWTVVLFVVCMGCLIAIWASGWTVINDVFQLDEIGRWNREITYDEIWQWLTGR